MNRRYRWQISRWGCSATFLALIILGGWGHLSWFRGSITATTFFAWLPFADPLATLEVCLASRTYHPTLLVGIGIPLLLCLLLGPVFCGWLCPLGLLLDLNQTLRRIIGRFGKNQTLTKPLWQPAQVIAPLLLGLSLGFSLTAALPAFQLLSPINYLVWLAAFGAQPQPLPYPQEAFGISLLLVPVLIVGAEWFLPRLWCRSLCPLGTLYRIIGHYAPVRIRIAIGTPCQAKCRRCSHRCPQGIPVWEQSIRENAQEINDPNCTRCGECLDSCPEKKLGFRR